MAAWDLALDGPPVEGAAGFVAPVVRRADGAEAYLKLGWPHPEAATEAAGLRFFDGAGAARLLAADEPAFALLVERVRPGDDLRALPPAEGARCAAGVLRRLWRAPDATARAAIRTLADEVAGWSLGGAVADRAAWLLATAPAAVVVHGDFNPTNVLRSGDDSWLAIDPKPLLAEPAYDLAMYLADHVDLGREGVRTLAEQLAAALDLDLVRVAGWAAVKAVGWSWGESAADLFATLLD